MRTLAIALALMIFPLSASRPAQAEIAPFANVALAGDDNIYRVAEGATLPAGASRTDIFYGLSGGVKGTAFLPGWTSDLDAEVTKTWFQRNDRLNNIGYTLSADASREAKRYEFHVLARQDRRLSSFSELRDTGVNSQTLLLANVGGTWFAIGDIGITAGASYARSTNTMVSQSDYERHGTVLGVSYRSPIGNRLSLEWRHSDARGLNQRFIDVGGGIVPDRLKFSEDRFGVAVKYDPTPFINLTGDGGYLRRQDKSLLNNDFRGVVGTFDLRLVPRDTIRLDAIYSRQLESTSQLFVDAIRVSSGTLAAEADVTASTLARLSYTGERRLFLTSNGALPVAGLDRQKINRLQFSVDQAVGNRFIVSFTGRHETRSGEFAATRFVSNGFLLGLRINFKDAIRQ